MQDCNVIIIDNYDSFTFNLVHLVNEIVGKETTVVKNDNFEMSILQDFSHIILSPGPGIPDEAGQLKEVISTYHSNKCILGVCLGMQAIGEVFGGKLKNLARVFHGMKTSIFVSDINDPIIGDINSPFDAGRYHSWVVEKSSCPTELLISSSDEYGEIMSFYHKFHKVYGVQFHPESIMTPDGMTMITKFLSIK